MEFFEIFGFEPNLEIDTKELKKRYYQKSREVHPDFFTLEDTQTQEDKLIDTTVLNAAYNALAQRISRIEYILTEYEQLEEGKNPLPQAFLMEVMELNEALAGLAMDNDAAELEKSQRMIEQLDEQLENDYQKINKAFQKEGKFSPTLLANLKDYFLKNRYLQRMKDNFTQYSQS